MLDEVKQYLGAADENALVDQAQNEHSAEAIRLLCANFKDFIESVINVTIQPGMERDDLVQEGNLAIINAAETFDKTRDVKFANYAMSQVRSKIVTAVRAHLPVRLNRKDAYSGSKFEEVDENTPDRKDKPKPETLHLTDQMESFFDVLTENEKTVINLTYYEDMQIADIAKVMGMHWRAVHKLKLSAVLKLKERMQGIVAKPKVRYQVNNERWGQMLYDIFDRKFKPAEVLAIKYSISLGERELIEEFHVHGDIKEFAENADLSIEELRARQRLIEKKMAHAVNQIISGRKTKVPVLNSPPTLNLADLWRNV